MRDEEPGHAIIDPVLRTASRGRSMPQERDEDRQPPQPDADSPARVQLPLVQSTRPASPDEQLTPERVAEILAQEETERLLDQ